MTRPQVNKTGILILGGGPTGLGAACRLHELGEEWMLLEAQTQFGGLAGSFVDEHGFTWDMGAHVQFSHYDTFDRYMQLALDSEEWLTHQRECWIWLKNRFVPYPFQNNLHRLDPEDCWACVKGLMEAKAHAGRANPKDFGEWMMATFGDAITNMFMKPYNMKVWAYPPHAMDCGWIEQRVPVPDFQQVLRSVCLHEDAAPWGPNAEFRFPVKGGTGTVWNSIGGRLPRDRVHLGTRVLRVDAKNKKVMTECGDEFGYEYLISSIPLNHLIRLHRRDIVDTQVADSLLYSSTNIVGVGVDGRPPDDLETKCWMYFPENNSPYYRVTVFSNLSPNNVARPGEQWSLMTETAESPEKPVQVGSLCEETVRALKEDQLLPENAVVVSVVHRRLEQGYPTPFLRRDRVVDPLLRMFEEDNIFSRGRFGAWKYEVANQDHSFAQGYECAQRIVERGGPEMEPTLFTPTMVNRQRNP